MNTVNIVLKLGSVNKSPILKKIIILTLIIFATNLPLRAQGDTCVQELNKWSAETLTRLEAIKKEKEQVVKQIQEDASKKTSDDEKIASKMMIEAVLEDVYEYHNSAKLRFASIPQEYKILADMSEKN